MISLVIIIICVAGITWILLRTKKNVISGVLSAAAAAAPKEELPDDGGHFIETEEQHALDFGEINRAFRIGDMHFTRGDFEKAKKYFVKVLSLHQKHTEAMNRLGVIYIQQRHPRKAEMLYRKLLSLTQKDPTYYCNYGRCLSDQKKYSEAIEAFENAVKLDATKANRFASIGHIYYELQRFEHAQRHFERALAIEPMNPEYLRLHAEVAEANDNIEQARQSLVKLSEIFPYDMEIKKRLSARQFKIHTPHGVDSPKTGTSP